MPSLISAGAADSVTVSSTTIGWDASGTTSATASGTTSATASLTSSWVFSGAVCVGSGCSISATGESSVPPLQY